MGLISILQDEYVAISGYTDNGFIINGHCYNKSVSVFDNTIEEIDNKIFEDIEHFKKLNITMSNEELLLIGTGKLFKILNKEFQKHFIGNKIKFEQMDSKAASRMYNVLISEGRKVKLLLKSLQ